MSNFSRLNIAILIFLFSSLNIFAQQQERMNITGEIFKQVTVTDTDPKGSNYREFTGSVIITQGNLKITCDRAIQYYEKDEAELIGNVVAVQDTITVKSPKGYYYAKTRTTFSDSGIELNDSHYTLKARTGYYYFNEKKADFTNNVNLFDKISNINADHVTYFRDENKAVAVGRVMVCDTSSVIFADSLIHFRVKKLTYGFKNVQIYNPGNKTIILSGKLVNNDSTGYSNITEKPLFIQVDSTAQAKFDTLYIRAKSMEAYQDSTNRFVAIDSVKMFRSNFSAVNNITTLFRKENKIFAHRLEGDIKPPVVWYEESQLYGDSIFINLEKKKLKRIDVLQNAFMLSLNEGHQYRYDQMSGRKIFMHFADSEIKRIDIEGALLSIYYLYDNKEPNGLVKASSERGKLYFKEKKVEDVKLYGSVVSDYHPENIILGKEKDFTLPGFILFKNKPRKEEFLTKEVEAALNKLSEIIKNSDGRYSNIKK
jgi:lipopolysaccharide export system protein LptA